MRTFVFGICSVLAISSIAIAEPDQNSFLLGGDISMLSRLEEYGVAFQKDGKAEDLIALMGQYGCNCFRLRLFVEPNGRGGVIQDVPYTIALAKRIKAAGAAFVLDLHYSDTWADPSHQTKPKAWERLSFEELAGQVRRYTAETIGQFKAAGVTPDMVQIGNEIAPGFLWPEGRLAGREPEAEWQRFTTLLKEGIDGLRQADPNNTVKTIIHIECGGDAKKTEWFFGRLEEYGVKYDIIGLSYYPWWHGSLDDLRNNLAQTAARFKKDIFVVEAAYFNRPFEIREGTYKDRLTWEKSAAGQRAFLCDVVRTVRDTPGGRGLGVLWWYPESVPLTRPGGWNDGATALFDPNGAPLPAMECFSENSVR
jgi:arabinogalactan endo-1,4-beta-galactosidase